MSTQKTWKCNYNLFVIFTLWTIIILTSSACQGQVISESGTVTPAPSATSDHQPVPITRTTNSLPNLTPTLAPTLTPTLIPTLTVTQSSLSILSSKILAGIIVVEREPGFAGQRVLFVGKPDGEITLIDNFSSVSSLAWSPDGQKFVFSALDLNVLSYKAYIANADGSFPMRIDIDLIGGAHRFSPSWSPDGSEIVFAQTGADKPYLHIMNIDGSNVRYLEEGLSPAWSPSGESIIFYKPLSDKIQDVGYLYSIGVDGGNLSQLTEDVYAGSSAWSPDGKMIAFQGYEENGENDGIYVMDSTGENLTFLTSIGGKPSWLPDSSQILVAEDGKLFIVSLDGSVQEFPNSNLSDYYFLYATVQP